MKGLVIKKNANLFTVESNGTLVNLAPSGKTRASGIFVGDFVEFDDCITNVYERKNLLIRPPIANLNKMFVVISQIPKPDFILLDKILIYCHLNDIQPIIVVNKSDIASEDFINSLKADYSFYKIIFVSALKGDISLLEKEINGICAFAGQSAVGKSSLINALFKSEQADVGHLSKKIERGKQTTRIVSLYKINDGYIADTAGFSMLDLSMVSNINERELSSYYPDFLKGRAYCKYRSCLHEGGDCGVIKLVNSGEISKRRYSNYLKILQELKNKNNY